jgi:transcriptional regulator with XRE-family HTH domain
MRTLKELRESSGMSQTEVAKLINANLSNYSNFESSQALPTLEDMVILENLFNEQIDWKENLSETDRKEIADGLIILLDRYPINSVLSFAQREIREGMRINHPSVFIKHYAKIATNFESPLIPPSFNKPKNKYYGKQTDRNNRDFS